MSTKQTEPEWGVVQRLEVEADTKTSLVAALTIALTYNHEVRFWGVPKYDQHSQLRFLHNGSPIDGVEIHRLPVNVFDPNKLADIAWDWLAEADYPILPDSIDSAKKGYRVTCNGPFAVCEIAPVWITYSK